MGVSVDARLEFNSDPVLGILDAARHGNCNLIYLSAHGRGGASPLFLGNVAHKILTLAQIPVLLDRPAGDEVVRAQMLMSQRDIEP